MSLRFHCKCVYLELNTVPKYHILVNIFGKKVYVFTASAYSDKE